MLVGVAAVASHSLAQAGKQVVHDRVRRHVVEPRGASARALEYSTSGGRVYTSPRTRRFAPKPRCPTCATCSRRRSRWTNPSKPRRFARPRAATRKTAPYAASRTISQASNRCPWNPRAAAAPAATSVEVCNKDTSRCEPVAATLAATDMACPDPWYPQIYGVCTQSCGSGNPDCDATCGAAQDAGLTLDCVLGSTGSDRCLCSNVGGHTANECQNAANPGYKCCTCKSIVGQSNNNGNNGNGHGAGGVNNFFK